MDHNLIVCRCEEVTLGEIIQAVEEGASTVSGVKKRTRACMGMCQGRVCQPLIKAVLAQKMESAGNENEIAPSTVRPPARSVLLGEIAGEN
ncbi:FAD-dependent pyridine nucleotide-disulphide oxidoreductase [Desulfocucumis palustris]|uniref:FAD-dependent pyridine nucleotide-disulphide oxidoreductase n=1 Tax=Desulfocucumis palustris TaxID=1898651 RepID=A0A2L2X8R3_9FIRM|nr:(2Fe-2S)-binding protein [Desulfocucumis palustris]GBF32575.1 FAD-dependent pyridine nucleotide-disulphide oxidoreductase [Desulfocucumis palustris]